MLIINKRFAQQNEENEFNFNDPFLHAIKEKIASFLYEHGKIIDIDTVQTLCEDICEYDDEFRKDCDDCILWKCEVGCVIAYGNKKLMGLKYPITSGTEIYKILKQYDKEI